MASSEIMNLLDVQQKAYKDAMQLLFSTVNQRVEEQSKLIYELKHSLEFSQAELQDVKEELKAQVKRADTYKILLDKQSDMIDKMQYRMDSHEDYTRYNNIRIDGVEEHNNENREQTENKVLQVLSQHLNIKDVGIDKCHRLSGKTEKATRTAGPRTIIARIHKPGDRDDIIRNSHKLRKTGIFINDDVSEGTMQVRKEKLQTLKDARRSGKIAYFVGRRLVIHNRGSDRQDHSRNHTPPRGGQGGAQSVSSQVQVSTPEADITTGGQEAGSQQSHRPADTNTETKQAEEEENKKKLEQVKTEAAKQQKEAAAAAAPAPLVAVVAPTQEPKQDLQAAQQSTTAPAPTPTSAPAPTSTPANAPMPAPAPTQIELPPQLLEAEAKFANLQNKYNEVAASAKIIKEDKNLSLPLAKAVGLINQLNNDRQDSNRGKLQQIMNLVSGKNCTIGEQSISVNNNAAAIAFVKDQLSSKIVNLGHDKQVASMCVYASLSVKIWQAFPAVGELILFRLYEVCPYLIPKRIEYVQNSSSEEYNRQQGYRHKDGGTCEALDKFLTRMGAAAQFYGRIVTMDVGTQSHPHGLNEGWKWFASILSFPPHKVGTAAVIQGFLSVAGSAFLKHYGKQFSKILMFIYTKYLPVLEKETIEGAYSDIATLKRLLETFQKTGNIPPPPEGYRSII